MNTDLKRCPYCKKENSISSKRCECGYYFDLVDYQKHSKEKIKQLFYSNKQLVKSIKYILLVFRILLFLVAIFAFGFGVLVILKGGIAEPFSKETMFVFGAIMFSPMVVFIIIELLILKSKHVKKQLKEQQNLK